MRYTTKRDEDEARERLHAFWDRGSLGDRPALLAKVWNHSFDPGPQPYAAMERKARELQPDWQVWFINQWVGKLDCVAEAMPGHTLDWGSYLTMPAVQVGAEYEFHDSAWVLPMPDLYSHPLPVFNREHPYQQAYRQCLTAVGQALGDRAFIQYSQLLDPLDTLSLLRTADTLCLDLLEAPETVKSWIAALTDLYLAIRDDLYRTCSGLGYPETICFFGPMSEGLSDAAMCDFAVMLSPEMFHEFVMPSMRRITAQVKNAVYHLDGTCQLRFLDMIQSLPNLHAIQWNPEPSAPPPSAWVDSFRNIRDRGLGLYVNCEMDEAIALCTALGPDGLCLVLPPFESYDEAEAAMAAITAAC